MEKMNEADISVFNEVKEHNDKKFQSLLTTRELLETCIQQERLQNESLTWDIKHLEGSNDVSKDKNLLEYQDLDQLTHQNEGLKEQIASMESQLDLADLNVTVAGMDLGEDTRVSSQRASSHQMEGNGPARGDKLKSLQQMSTNLQKEIARTEKMISELESAISNIQPVDMDGICVLLSLVNGKGTTKSL